MLLASQLGSSELSHSERILTVPQEEHDQTRYFVLANEYVAIPEIRQSDGAIMSVNALLASARGLLEFTGRLSEGQEQARPLLQPELNLAGQRVQLAGTLEADLIEDWIPRFRGHFQGLFFSITYFAPPGYRGFVAELEIENRGQEQKDCQLGLSGRVGRSFLTIFHRRSLEGSRVVRFYPWTKSLVIEAMTGFPVLAMAIKGWPEGAALTWWEEEGLPNETPGEIAFAPGSGENEVDEKSRPRKTRPLGPTAGSDLPPSPLRADNLSPRLLGFRLTHTVRLNAGEKRTFAFFMTLGTEADGAATAGIDLARRGLAGLWQETLAKLRTQRRLIPDPQLSRRFHQNLFFNFFFTRGRTLDTDQLVLVTSRSPRYYVSAAHWSRDSLLWSFPALLLADPQTAREALLAAFALYTRNAGVHALYIDGGVLYPGFELDELAAFFIALERYVLTTGDRSILEEEEVRRGRKTILEKMAAQRHPELALYRTFLLPSDDPAQYPFVTYDNALLWVSLRFLAQWYRWDGDEVRAKELEVEAAALKDNLYRYGVVSGPVGPMFAWAFQPGGEYVLYDEPPGSLVLLAYYGFCSPEDPIYGNTVSWIKGPDNPYWIGEGFFATPACPHVPHPWVLALANELLAGKERLTALKQVALARLDNGYACETIDRHSGQMRTGAAFATCAGWLATAVWEALERPPRLADLQGRWASPAGG